MVQYFRNNRGSGLLVALVLTGLIAIIMIALLERLVPSSKNVRGFENSVVAYYVTHSAIEQALGTLQIENPGHMADSVADNTNLSASLANGSKYTINEASFTIPGPGNGTSEYDSNWSSISPGKPVQLYIPSSFISEFPEAVIDIRVPSTSSTDILAGESSLTQFHTDLNNFTAVSLLITNGTDTLLATTNNTGACPVGGIGYGLHAGFINKSGLVLGKACVMGLSDAAPSLLETKITAGFCSAGCTLKLSTTSELKNISGNSIPHLEYRVRKNVALDLDNCIRRYRASQLQCSTDMRFTQLIPNQFATINATSAVSGYKRSVERSIEQLTTSEGLDFTIFQ